MSRFVTTVWAGWFQDVSQSIITLGETVDQPPLRFELFGDDKLPTRPWGPGYFQSVIDAINRLFATALLPDRMVPAPLSTIMVYDPDRNVHLAWVGFFQSIANAIRLVGGTVIDAPFAAILVQ